MIAVTLWINANNQGYSGKGYELRARKTWPLYPPATREALVEYPIAFPEWFPNSMEEWERGTWPGRDECPIKDDCFIIGNHADEITVRRAAFLGDGVHDTAVDAATVAVTHSPRPALVTALLPSHS
jgi:hypothetical protein